MRRAVAATGLTFWAVLLIMRPVLLCGQGSSMDLSGTWVGQTEIPDTTDKVDVALVLKKAGNDYSGTITLSKAKDAALQEFSWQDEDTLQFYFSMPSEGDPLKVKVKLDVISDKLQGNKLMGTWVMDDGSYGTLDLLLKK